MFKKTSSKIILGIVLINTIVLIFVSLFAVNRAQDEFKRAVTVEQFLTPNEPQAYVYSSPMRTNTMDGNVRKDFDERFAYTILGGAFVGFLLSIFAGIFFSRLITKPLSHLQQGIKDLKENNKKTPLQKTGEEEFDNVINEFNDLAKELDYQEELRSNLISDVAHELKTPITGLTGQLQGIKDKVFKLDDKRIDMLIKEMNRLNELVNTLNEHTRIKSSLPDLNIVPLNIYEIVNQIYATHEKLLKDKEINFHNEIKEGQVLSGDKNLIMRMIINIIENAIYHSEGKNIYVSMDNSALIIKDDGKGIPQEEREKIFERFYRIEKSRNRKTGGLGLGLSMVKEIAMAHGWEIFVKEIENQNGTQFVIKFESKN